MRQSSPEATEIFYLSQIDEALREKYSSTEYSRIPLSITGDTLSMEHYIKESIEPEIPDFSPSEKGAVHIIQAESGSGKTILCQRLLFDWANKRGIWAKARFVFYVSSTQILEEEMKNSFTKEEMNKIKLNTFIYKHLGLAETDDLDKIIENYDQEIIFILDGYDELLTHNLHDLSLIQELVKKTNIFVFTRSYGIVELDKVVKDSRDPANRKFIKKYEFLPLQEKEYRTQYINVLFKNSLSSSDKQSNSQLFFSWLFNGRIESTKGNILFGDIVTKPLSLQFLAGAWKGTFQDRLLPNKYQLLMHYVGYATNRFLIKRGRQPDKRKSMLTLVDEIHFLTEFMKNFSNIPLLLNNQGIPTPDFESEIKKYSGKYKKICDANNNALCQYKEKIMRGTIHETLDIDTGINTQIRLDLLDLNLIIDKTGMTLLILDTDHCFSNQIIRDFFHYWFLADEFSRTEKSTNGVFSWIPSWTLNQNEKNNQFLKFFEEYKRHFLKKTISDQPLKISLKVEGICELVSHDYSDRLPDLIEKFYPGIDINPFTVLPAIACLNSILRKIGILDNEVLNTFKENTINYFKPWVSPSKKIELSDPMKSFLLYYYVFSHYLARELGIFDALAYKDDSAQPAEIEQNMTNLLSFIQQAGLYDPTLKGNFISILIKASNEELLIAVTDSMTNSLSRIGDHPTKSELHELIKKIVESANSLTQFKSIRIKQLLHSFNYLDADWVNYLIDSLTSSNFLNVKQLLSVLLTQLDDKRPNQMVIDSLIQNGSLRAIETLVGGHYTDISHCEGSLIQFLKNLLNKDITPETLIILNLFLKETTIEKAGKKLSSGLSELQKYFNSLLDHTNIEVNFFAAKFFLLSDLAEKHIDTCSNVFKPLHKFLNLKENLWSPPYHKYESRYDCSCDFIGQEMPDKRVITVMNFLLFLTENKKFQGWLDSNPGQLTQKKQAKLINSVLFFYDCSHQFEYSKKIFFNSNYIDLLNALFHGSALFNRLPNDLRPLNITRSAHFFRIKKTLRCYAKSNPSILTNEAGNFFNLYPMIIHKLDSDPQFINNLEFIAQISELYTHYYRIKIEDSEEAQPIINFISALFSSHSPYKNHVLLNLLLLSSSRNEFPEVLSKTSEIMYNFRSENRDLFSRKIKQIASHMGNLTIKSVLEEQLYNYGVFNIGWNERFKKVSESLSLPYKEAILDDFLKIDISPDEILETSSARRARPAHLDFFSFISDSLAGLVYFHGSVYDLFPTLVHRVSKDWESYRSSFFTNPVFPLNRYQRIPLTSENPCYYREGYTNFLEYGVDALDRHFYAKPGFLDPSERAIDLPLPRCQQPLDGYVEKNSANIYFPFMLGFTHGITLAGSAALTKALTNSEHMANMVECAVSYAFLLNSLMAHDTNAFNLLAPLMLSIIVKNSLKWGGYSPEFSQAGGGAASLSLSLAQSRNTILIWFFSQMGNRMGYSLVNSIAKQVMPAVDPVSATGKKPPKAAFFATPSENKETDDSQMKAPGCLTRVVQRVSYMKKFVFWPMAPTPAEPQNPQRTESTFTF